MIKFLPYNLTKGFLAFMFVISSTALFAQGYALRLETNNNFGTAYVLATNTPVSGILSTTVQANANGSQFLIEWDNYYNKWTNTAAPKNQVLTYNFTGGGSIPNSQLSGGFANGKYYTFQIKGASYSNRQGVIMETDNAPRAFNATASTAVSKPSTVCAGSSANITVTLAGAKSPQERVFIRYAINNNFATSQLVEATGTGTTWTTATAVIPASANAAGNTINYYAYSTTVAATSSSDHDLILLRLANNAGSNYAYTVLANNTYYADVDGDGFGNINSPMTSCTQPVGYVTNNTDCDDNNQFVNAKFPFYADNDGDGIGAGAASMQCAVDAYTPPVGFSMTNTDCDDSNPNRSGLFSFYLDSDSDGYGTGNLISGICAFDADTAPGGYSTNNEDCDDTNYKISPGMGEKLYNGVDDNCNGLLDEGFEVKTKIQPSQCGATLAKLYSSVAAVRVTGATGYTFHVRKLPVNPAFTPINDPAAQHIVTNNFYFAMSTVPGVEYGADYEVSVEVRMTGNSVFVGYVGEPCRIGTPPVLAPGVSGGSNQCGTTLPNFYSTIGTTPVNSAVAYKFFIKDIATAGTGGLPANYVGESIERSVQWFTLSMFQNVGYGRTYELQVAVKTSANGAFSPYSPVCVITTPPAQPLVNCEASIPAKYTNIATTNLSRVTQYEFELTNIGSAEPDPITTSTILTSKNYFNFNQLPAANYYAGIEYGVRVRVYVNNIVSEWTDPCVIISPAAAGRQSQDNVLAGQGFNAIALPNPFANSFAISVSTSSIEAVSYKVYDMTGRLLEARTAAVSDMASQEIGDRYPAGVYNVIVSQGTEIKTLRVIKR